MFVWSTVKPSEYHTVRYSNAVGFQGAVPGLRGFKELCPGERQNWVRDAKCLEVFQVIYNISDTAYEHFDFPTVGENICRNRTASNQPVTGRNRIGKGRCVDW